MLQAGKHPGKINFTDLDNALNILKFLTDRPAAAIMKHTNPCGVACGTSVSRRILQGQLRRPDRRLRRLSRRQPGDGQGDGRNGRAPITLRSSRAPEYEEGTVNILAQRKNLRIIRLKKIHLILISTAHSGSSTIKSLIDGGFVVQQSPLNGIRSKEDFLPAKATFKGKDYVIERTPTEREYDDMIFGWSVEQGVTLEFGHFCERWCHRRHRHGRAGPCRRCGDRRVQGLYQVCRRPLL
ncbi:MAG: hypothetical protein MZV70_59330 [Desulfobacterales bacterium]|nr:hypothetical protein [Desulfobacterales bacterium]